PWCGPCQAVGPILEELAVEYKGRLLVAKMNVDENQSIPARFGVRSIPNMVIFKGGEEVARIIGSRPKSDLKETIDPLL
ncbi:MAG: thioredoxin family protein, partial [Candidatus Adiutrix sp.]